MADAFDEVEETIRRERLAKVARQGWPWALGIVIAIILGILGWNAYQDWRVQRGHETVEQLEAARDLLQKGDTAGAAAAFSTVAEEASGTLKALALSEEAGALLAAGETEAARERLESAAEAATLPLVREAATLKAAYLAADTEDLAALRARLDPMIEDNGAYAFLARELLAAKAFEVGDAAAARERYQYLASALETPEGVRQRARAALTLLGPAETVAEKPEPSQTNPSQAAPGAAP